MLLLAAYYAITPAGVVDRRHHRLGAVGVRRDGALVHARNGASVQKNPSGHAEARLCRKLDQSAKVFVARVLRKQPLELALARPCVQCLARLKSHGVRRVYYTVSEGEWGILEL